MSASFSFLLAVLPFISQVSAFGACDSSIIENLNNSNLTAFPVPKVAAFENTHFKYDYISALDAVLFQSADIVFGDSSGDVVLAATLNRYRGITRSQVSTSITFTEQGDEYSVDFKGFVDSPTSENQVYIFNLEGLVVAYYCSTFSGLDGPPLFTINTPIDFCNITEAQVNAVEDTISGLNNNAFIPLVKLRNPPTSSC